MEIRFPCPSCKQPIEIDQEWASRAVACPYCRKTVTAPAESTLGPIDDIPMGRPLSAPQMPSDEHPATQPPTPSSTLSVAALITACSMIAMVMITSAVALPHASELIEMQQTDGTLEENLQAMQRLIDSEGGSFPTWLVVVVLLTCVSMFAWLGAVVLGILALYRSSRKNLAAIALGICGLFLIMSLL